MAVKEGHIGEILGFCLKVKRSDGFVEYKVSPEKEEKQDD